MVTVVSDSGTNLERSDTDHSHELDLHLGRMHPGDACRMMFLSCTPQVDEAVKKLEEALDYHGADRDPDSIATLTKAMITPLRQISYIEYQELVGMVDLARNKHGVSFIYGLIELIKKAEDNVNYSSAYKVVLGNLKKIYELQSADEINCLAIVPLENGLVDNGADAFSKFNRDFAEQTILLVRSVYPLGVNVLNPDWSGRGESFSVSADREKFGFWLVSIRPEDADQVVFDEYERQRRIDELNQSGGVVVRPAGERSRVTFYAPGTGLKDPIPEEYEVFLSDGEAIVIGRPLQIKSLYGMDFQEEGIDSVEVKTDLSIAHKHDRWSRGGVMLARMDGCIYLFDRGSKWSIANPEQSGAIATYTGRSIMTDIGKLSYGMQSRSVVPELPQGRNYTKTVQAVLLPDDENP